MVKKLLSVFIAAASAGTLFAAANDIPLEWNPRFDTTLSYETVLDRNKLEKLAGVGKDQAIEVFAVSKKGETKLDTAILDSNVKGVETLRFKVPAGTVRLIGRAGSAKVKKSCANSTDNLFAGALKSTSKWSVPKNTAAKVTANGVSFKIKSHGTSIVKYFVTLPAGYAGTPAKLEFTVKSLSKITWGNG
ncbi:MAG: hypothetical protein J6R00_06580, partial [Lentisphaeria bacterium]|nr:hypothetical protein [Lentisphaeria bacterium]